MTFFEIACEAHSRGATIYVIGMFGEMVASRIERWFTSLPHQIVSVRLDLRGVSYIDPVSFVRVARAFTRWRDAHGPSRGRRVSMQFPDRSKHRAMVAPFVTGPGAFVAPGLAHDRGSPASTSLTY